MRSTTAALLVPGDTVEWYDGRTSRVLSVENRADGWRDVTTLHTNGRTHLERVRATRLYRLA